MTLTVSVLVNCSDFNIVNTLNFNIHYCYDTDIGSKYTDISVRNTVHNFTRLEALKQTNRQTVTQTKYCNPRCACAPRVNNYNSHFMSLDLIWRAVGNNIMMLVFLFYTELPSLLSVFIAIETNRNTPLRLELLPR